MRKLVIALSVVLVFFVSLFVIPAMASDTSGTCGDNVTWDLSNGILTISGTGEMTEYTKLASVPWYSSRASITSVVIEDGVTSIGAYAFGGCSALNRVTIGNGVTTISKYAFAYCPTLTSVRFPMSITSIVANAFYDSPALTYAYYAGSEDDWANITIGTSNDCLKYASFYYSVSDSFNAGDNLIWTIEDGTLTISGTGPMADYNFGEAPWFTYDDEITKVVVKSGVTSIGNNAFWAFYELTSVSLPNSVISIGDGAFQECESLQGIVLPTNLTSIGDDAFVSCNTITSVTIPSKVTDIGEYAFAACANLKYVSLPDGLSTISNGMVADCISLTILTIPNSVKSIGEYALAWCESLTSIEIPEGVISIGDYAFQGCTTLASITIPISVTTVGEEVCYECDALANVYYGGSYTRFERVVNIDSNNYLWYADITCAMPDEAGYCGYGYDDYYDMRWELYEGVLTFSGSVAMYEFVTPGDAPWYYYRDEVVSVVVEDGVESIGQYAFYGCSAITSITIGDDVIAIGTDAFNDCVNLTDVWYAGSLAQWNAISIADNNASLTNATIHCAKVDAITPTITTQISAATITAPADGWVEGTNTFTVTADDACVVAVSYDGGETYTRLTATAVDGGYSFTADNMTADTTVAVVQAGDASGDGVVDGVDQAQTKAMALGKLSVSALNQAVLDVNKDGTVDGIDAAQLKAAVLGKLTLSW